ncbi:type III polyketide synthase [Stieleria sp. JC731]|uniref:type III polyketide synthase n=1 Tax=Pirellulaceae TaxID=2691357 RepID=UPI001E55A748|nr:type III polyketide synthase [Stieleria sp. JC731]MCC9603708.1 type III polyketide synthase [Stieleria sp. JC731]
MPFQILGLGTATPLYGIAQEDAADIAKSICGQSDQQHRALEVLYRKSGVRYRHSVALDKADEQPIDRHRNKQPLLTKANHDASYSESSQPSDLNSVCLESQSPLSRQSFFPAAVGAQDAGPSTDQRMQMYREHAGSLAVTAAEEAIANSPFESSEFTHLITVSCTGFQAPGVDLDIIKQCQLRPTVERTHIGFMGCHGAINGLRVAKAIAEADPNSRVLLCAVELCTLHQQYGWHPERVVSNALFADGAAALVGASTELLQSTPARKPCVAATGSMILPETEGMMGWQIGDHGFVMSLSTMVPSIICQTIRQWMEQWLHDQGLCIDEIQSWAIHPGGPKILKACQEAMSLTESQLRPSFQILESFGNMSSPTVLFVLDHILDSPQPTNASPLPCVMLAFGPGLAIEAALIR